MMRAKPCRGVDAPVPPPPPLSPVLSPLSLCRSLGSRRPTLLHNLENSIQQSGASLHSSSVGRKLVCEAPRSTSSLGFSGLFRFCRYLNLRR